MRILIADSDPVRMDLYKRILERDYHEVLTAENRFQTDLAYKKGRIDLIVSDSEMWSEIENLVRFNDTPRVVISKLNDEETKALQERGLQVENFSEKSLRYGVLELAVA